METVHPHGYSWNLKFSMDQITFCLEELLSNFDVWSALNIKNITSSYSSSNNFLLRIQKLIVFITNNAALRTHLKWLILRLNFNFHFYTTIRPIFFSSKVIVHIKVNKVQHRSTYTTILIAIRKCWMDFFFRHNIETLFLSTVYANEQTNGQVNTCCLLNLNHQ